VVKSNSLYPAALGVTMGKGGNEYDLNPPATVEPEPSQTRKPDTTQLRACQDWLSEWLSGGQQRVSNTRTEAELHGFPAGTLYRAKDRLEIEEVVLEGKKWWRFAANGQT
jgi:hypothetical protein